MSVEDPHDRYTLSEPQPLSEQMSAHNAAMWLAYGFYEDIAAYHRWLRRNGEMTSRMDDPEPMDTPMIKRYDHACGVLRSAAREGLITLYGRPPLDQPSNGWYPTKFGDFAAIPAAVFRDESIRFSYDEFGGLYREKGADDSPFMARWFHVSIDAGDLRHIAHASPAGISNTRLQDAILAIRALWSNAPLPKTQAAQAPIEQWLRGPPLNRTKGPYPGEYTIRDALAAVRRERSDKKRQS